MFEYQKYSLRERILRHDPAARRRTRRGEDRGKLGGEERRSPDSLQARLGSRWQDRPLPPQRRTAELPAEGPRRLPRLGHHEQYDRQGTQDRHPRSCSPPRNDTLQGRSPPPLGAGSAPFLCRAVKATAHGGAIRATANSASLRSPAARRSSNVASPPHGTALRAIAIRGRLRATWSHLSWRRQVPEIDLS